jgi:hypothetical protein
MVGSGDGTAQAAPAGTQNPGTPRPVSAAARPAVVGFRRVLPGSGPVGSLALKDGPLHYRVDIKNPSNSQVSKQVLVKRMPGTAAEVTVASFMANIPQGDTRAFSFSDPKSIADGCNSTRYLITVEDGAARVGRVKPTCTFTFTTTGSTSGPQGQLPANPACNQPWGLSANVGVAAPPMPGPPGMPASSYLLALRSVQNGAIVIAHTEVQAGTVTATLTDPFRGIPGTFGLTYTKQGHQTPSSPPPSTAGAWRVAVARTCTVDLGSLE